jgi:hypothetical protein
MVAVVAVSSAAAQDLPTWSLGTRGVQLDGGAMPFYRVTGAQFLPDGSIAVADAGNARVAVYAPSGNLLRSLGREGDGPGEFRSLSHLFVFGDTIAVYDQIALRFTIWDAIDARPRSFRYLTYGVAPPTVQGAFSSTEYLLTSVERTPREARGLFIDHADLLRHTLAEPEAQVLGRGPHRYLYFFGERSGTTTYRTPFFGATAYAIAGGTIVTVPLHAARMRLLDPRDGREVADLQLPLEERKFDRREITRYRDALLERAHDAATASRIRDAFDGIEPPATAPTVRDLVVVGELVWVERFPKFGQSPVTWVIVDPDARRAIATIELPAGSRPMSGRGESVLRAKSRTWRGFATTIGTRAAASAATTGCSNPPVASHTTSTDPRPPRRPTSSLTPASSFATCHVSPLGRTATSSTAFDTSIPTYCVALIVPPRARSSQLDLAPCGLFGPDQLFEFLNENDRRCPG